MSIWDIFDGASCRDGPSGHPEHKADQRDEGGQVVPVSDQMRWPARRSSLVRRHRIRRLSRDGHHPHVKVGIDTSGKGELSPHAVAHIIERIIDYTPWEDKFVWRQTCSAFRHYVDKTIFAHISVRYDGLECRYPEDVVIKAPGNRPLPHLCLTDEATLRRSLQYTKVVDWHLVPTEPDIQLQPLFNSLPNLRLVRRTEAGLHDIPAPAIVDFVCVTSANTWRIGRWSAALPPYGEAGPYPRNMKKLTFHIDFDPTHPNLRHTWWDEQVYHYLAGATELTELTVILVPCHNRRREIDPLDIEAPDLGLLDSLVAFGSLVLWRGGSLKVVGSECVPRPALNLLEEDDIVTEIRALVSAWPATFTQWVSRSEIGSSLEWGHHELGQALSRISLSTIDQFKYEVGESLYELLLRRPEGPSDHIEDDDRVTPVFPIWK